MPIFEAMRMGVPVLCWGRTALSELMQDHPFTLDQIDLPEAAAAISLLDQLPVREAVEKIQAQILTTYTAQVVMQQIDQAILGVGGHWQYAQPNENVMQNSLRLQISDLKKINPMPKNIGDVSMDFGQNYVTLYDIEAYDALLAVDNRIALLPDIKGAQDSVTFSFREFISPRGAKMENGLTFSASEQSSWHVVYGPYAVFVRGYFSAEFEIETEQSGDGSVEVEFDIAEEGLGTIAAKVISARLLKSSTCVQLLFPISRDNLIVEFRIRIKRPGNCHFLFKGVTIRNVRQTIRGLQQTSKQNGILPKWMPRIVRPKEASAYISPNARQQFKIGDAARDCGFWNDAAAAYAAGLQIEPRVFAYQVQLGNCLKEAKCFEQSEQAYLAALALNPDDRDANLQLGRLFRQTGNSEGAHFHLLKAARIEISAAAAMHELAEMGFDISSFPDIFS